MPRLIIDYPDDMPAHDACLFASWAIEDGKISESAGVPHFCWVTQFTRHGVVVRARRKKRGQKSDSLLIYRTQDP